MEDKQIEIGLRLTNILAGIIQVIEAVAIITIVSLTINKGFNELILFANSEIFSYIAIAVKSVMIGGVVIGGFMVADAMKWVQYSSLIALVKDQKKAAGMYFAFLILIGFGFYKAEKSASENIGHSYFELPEDKKAYTDDANYTLRLKGKNQANKEWEDRKRELESQKNKCVPCNDIDAKYNAQIAIWKSKRIVTDADRTYVRKNIDAIVAKREAEKIPARQKHESEINQKYFSEEAQYKSTIQDAEATIKRIESTIDTGKVLNREDVEKRKKDINFWASGFSLITLIAQIILRVGRFHFLKENDRIDEVWDENNLLLDLLQTLPFVGRYFEDTYWVEKFSNFKKVKDANRVEYNKSQVWNTELSLKRKAKYWAYLKDKGLKDGFWGRLNFAFSKENTMLDEDLLDELSDAYENGYSKKKINNSTFFAPNPANPVHLGGSSDGFSESIQEIIDILLDLKPLYSDVEFQDIQDLIEILENLKTL